MYHTNDFVQPLDREACRRPSGVILWRTQSVAPILRAVLHVLYCRPADPPDRVGTPLRNSLISPIAPPDPPPHPPPDTEAKILNVKSTINTLTFNIASLCEYHWRRRRKFCGLKAIST